HPFVSMHRDRNGNATDRLVATSYNLARPPKVSRCALPLDVRALSLHAAAQVAHYASNVASIAANAAARSESVCGFFQQRVVTRDDGVARRLSAMSEDRKE